jgi:putative lipoic acid-binding regulatory protein
VSGTQGNGDGDQAIDTHELLKFPCRYEIKAMGRESVRFEALVHGIVTGHIGRDHLLAIGRKSSRNGRYLSVTCIIWATSRDQVEMIYGALKDCPDVLMTL